MRKVIFVLILMILIISQPLLAVTEPITEKNKSTIAFDLTYMGSTQDNWTFEYIYGLKVEHYLRKDQALTLDILMAEGDYQLYSLYLNYKLKEPIMADTWTFIQAGYSNLNYIKTNQQYGGMIVGARFSRSFNDNDWAHTSIRLNIYSATIIPVFATGFESFITNDVSVSLEYKGHNLSNHGLTAGIHFHFN